MSLKKEPDKLVLTMKFSKKAREKGRGRWIAECMELDIVFEAETLSDAIKIIGELCATQIQYAKDYNNWEYLGLP